MHPLNTKKTIKLELPHQYAAVRAMRRGNNLVVQKDSLFFAKAGTSFGKLLETNFKVVLENGQPVEPSGHFYISLETIDPYHAIIDWNTPK